MIYKTCIYLLYFIFIVENQFWKILTNLFLDNKYNIYSLYIFVSNNIIIYIDFLRKKEDNIAFKN